MTGPSNDPTMQMVRASCPDPEALAAWLDQGVGAAERAQIEAHLAMCDDCRYVVARVLEARHAVDEPRATLGFARLARLPSRLRGPRRKVMWGAASVFAAAAVLVGSVQILPSRWQFWRAGSSIDSKLADLAAAVGTERTVEARLTGGFQYGPLRAPVRSGGGPAASDNWTLFAAAGKIREEADRDPTSANLHALGAALLVLGDYENAVRAFEDAIAEDPQNARYHSDLAAAYLSRARQMDRPDDFPRALGAAERAVKADDTLIEARFNRALALEALFLDDQAKAAWEDYLTRDSTSGWAEEARWHLADLQKKAAARPDLPRDHSPPPITDTTVEAGLDWLLRTGLPSWAEAILAGDSARAAREHRALLTYAQQISTASQDPFAMVLVNVNDGDAHRLSKRAAAIRGFAEGLAHLEAENTALAEATLSRACAKADSALILLCHVELGAIDILKRDDSEVERRLSAIEQSAEARGSGYIRGRENQVIGYRRLFKGDYSGAIGPEREAFAIFDKRYPHQAGVVANQLAELFDVIGLTSEGWKWRIASLENIAARNDKSQRYVTWVSTAEMLGRRQEYEAAATFINALPEEDVSTLAPLRRVILLVARARILLGVGDLRTARVSLQQALALLQASSDFRTKRLMPDVLSLRAAIEKREANLDRATVSLTEAIASMGPERSAHRATALIARAGLSAGVPGGVDSSQDLNDAIGLLRRRVAAPTDQPLRLEEAVGAFRAAANLIRGNAAFHSQHGLHLVEQLRELIDGVPRGRTIDLTTDLQGAVVHGRATRVVVFYLFSDESLLTWVITHAGVIFQEQHARPEEIARLVNVLTVQVNRSPNKEGLWRQTLSDIHALVLRDLPGLANTNEITIVPDGPLKRVPFGALFDANTSAFVFERTSVRIVPNLAFAIDPGGDAVASVVPLQAAAVGAPTLWGPGSASFQPLAHAKAEVRAVANLYKDAIAIVGDGATKPRLLQALASADVVHYAGHAIASSDPRGSRLLLSGDVSDPRAALTGNDLAGHVSKPVRVVLAACETASTSADRAIGLTNLSAAFLRAGAGAIVASLWDVDDAASELFYLNVHRGLLAGQNTAAAVTRAQRACRADDRCRRAAATWIGTTVYGSQ